MEKDIIDLIIIEIERNEKDVLYDWISDFNMISKDLRENIISLIGHNIRVDDIVNFDTFDKLDKEISRRNKKELNMLYNYLVKF